MIEITITGTETGGKALLYEYPKREGRRVFVPTYEAWARCRSSESWQGFSVVRDTSAQALYGMADRYGLNGECPPSGETPYRGVVREDGYRGFRVQLFEPSFGNNYTLQGLGSLIRTEMQIHFGAAASKGCLLVAGRRREYPRNFERPLRAMLKHSSDIIVRVLPRERPHLPA